jgi:hypothetical protein
MTVKITSISNAYQVVDAATRGDACYEGRTGWWWHKMVDDIYAIDTSTCTGPFATSAEAWADMEAKRDAA